MRALLQADLENHLEYFATQNFSFLIIRIKHSCCCLHTFRHVNLVLNDCFVNFLRS